MSGNAAFWRGLNAWRVCVKTELTLMSTPYSKIHIPGTLQLFDDSHVVLYIGDQKKNCVNLHC